MKNKIIIAVLAISMMGFYSCRKLHDWNQPKGSEVEYSAIWPLAGEWYVLYQFDDGAGNIGDWYGVGYTTLYTYNTAAEETNKMWISDDGNFWAYTVKANCNVEGRSFGSDDSLTSTADWGGSPYDIKVLIRNGKVIEGGGHSTSGVVCDSIYFEVEYEDDPGTIYYCAGTRRTGFLEDEH